VTITLPDAWKRFMSLQVFHQDEYTPMVVYGKGTYSLTKEEDWHAILRGGCSHLGESG
jgi:hypothetical protein